MNWRIVRYLLTILAGLPAIAVLGGVGGLLMACHSSALIPANFYGAGNCHASDAPAEVFASFAFLGLILGGPILIASIVGLGLGRSGRHERSDRLGPEGKG